MPYDDPFRLRVMMGIQAVIESIVPSSDNQYVHNLTGKVFRGRALFGDSDPIPMVSILEHAIPPDQIDSPPETADRAGRWELLIQGFAEDDADNPTDPAYRLSADVVAALAKEKRRIAEIRRSTGKGVALFGISDGDGTPLVSDLQIGSAVCRPPDQISSNTYFWLRISVSLAEDLENPYD